ncbi:MAG: hypothetical protein WD772_08705 [Pseudohongiellaceae bacterium]
MAKFRRTARFPSIDSLPGHSMAGEWAYPGIEISFLDVVKMHRWMPKRAAQSIRFDEICAKPGIWNGIDEFAGPRYEAADTTFPGIVIAGMYNPCQLPFRLVDGRRRMEKLRRTGAENGMFQVYSVAEAEQFIVEVVQKKSGSFVS